MQPRWVGSLAFAAAALCCFGVDAKPGGTFRQLQKACDTLLDPDLELGDSAAALSVCAAYVQDEQPSAREVAALAARARRLGMAGNTEAADFALSAALTQLARRGSILEGVRRVDQTGTVEPTECLPIWRTIEHDRQMAQTDGEEAEESRIRLNALANDWRRDHGRLRALGSNAAATEASRDAILDHISAVSRATDCDSSMVTLGDGSWFDVATLSSDTRFRQGALNAPLHGWFLTTMHIFVPEQLQDLCERAPADGRALGAQAESSSPGPSAVLCRLADGEAGGAGRRLFESPQHHADAVEAAFAHARQLSLKALSNKDRTRGQRTRVMFAVDFEDQQWTPSADEVIRVFKRGARETQAKYDLMSYGAWQGSETVLPTIYRVVNATFAEVRAAASAAMLRSVGEWIVQNHPDPSKRVRLSDWDHQSITFPDINTFSWAGLAQAPGSFGELLGGYRGAAYAVIHENGHNLGLLHAGFLTNGYGNQNDNMGCCKRGHWFTQRKAALHWIPRGVIAEVAPSGASPRCPHCSRGGSFAVWPHDVGVLPPGFESYPVLGATSDPPRGDASDGSPVTTPAQPGATVLSVVVASNPASHSGVDGQDQLWLDAKAEETETGAGQLLMALARTTTSQVKQSSYQPTSSRKNWGQSSLSRGDAFVATSERLIGISGVAPMSGDRLLDAIGAGSRPAMLVESLTEFEAVAAGLLPPGQSGSASNGTFAVGVEPQPKPVPNNFEVIPAATRPELVQDRCWLGVNAAAGAGLATLDDAACSSIVRPVRVGFLGPSGERATLGGGCDLARGMRCEVAPSTGHGEVRVTPGQPVSEGAPAGLAALASALSGLEYHGSVVAPSVDAPVGGWTPRRRLYAPTYVSTDANLLVVSCAEPTQPAASSGVRVSSEDTFVAAYAGDFPVHEVSTYGAQPTSALGPIGWARGGPNGVSKVASSLGVDTSAIQGMCGAGAGAAALVVSSSGNSVSARAAALRVDAASGKPSTVVGGLPSASAHGLPGSLLPSLHIVAGGLRNNSLTRPWSSAPVPERGQTGAGQLRVVVHVMTLP
ncbi:unnamed protein product, partial [Symbiodinium sp. KB8]